MFLFLEAFLAHEAMRLILDEVKPSVFIGSDSGGPSARAEILTAKERGITTISTPHGYQSYEMPRYNYLADKLLTHGPATKKILIQSGLPESQISIIGTSHPRRDKSLPIDPKRLRIVIGTRSWGGLWSNYSSRQNIYHQIMQELLGGASELPDTSVVIKSHPNGDYHAYYDLLVARLNKPNLAHIPKGWTTKQFGDACDILVCVGEMPSLFISALYLKIPIVFITGAMTKTQTKLHYTYQGLGSVVSGAQEALQEIHRISTDPQYYAAAMAKQNEFAQGYDVDKPETALVKVIHENL